MDITNANVHEKAHYVQLVFVREPKNYQGTFTHEGAIGVLKKIFGGGKSAVFYYMKGVMRNLKKGDYKATEADPCVIYKHSPEGELWRVITVDAFLIFGSTTPYFHEFYTHLEIKYKMKQLGRPALPLEWRIQTKPAGNICLRQPEMAQATIEAAGMMISNTRSTLYVDRVGMHVPDGTEAASHKPDVLYQSLVGDLRYLADYTIPHLSYIVGKLGAGNQVPAQRHW